MPRRTARPLAEPNNAVTFAGCLTVKLRGRAEAPNRSRGRTLSSGARGDATHGHGPLQRLLGGSLGTDFLNRIVEHSHRSLEVSRFIRTHELVLRPLCTVPQAEFVT